jgi:FkbM family methyltransferase
MKNKMFFYARRFVQNPLSAVDRLSQMEREAVIFEETFVEQAYFWLYKKIRPKTTVLDIGAYFGDTAVYFAMNPYVEKVYAFEPMPQSYKMAKEFIRKNPFKSKITLRNEAIAENGQKRFISTKRAPDGSYSFLEANDAEGKLIKSRPLGEVLSGLENVVIKCDIEGAEKTIFKRADLRQVYAIQLEYHNCKDDVLRVLSSKGFKTRCTFRPADHPLICAWKS